MAFRPGVLLQETLAVAVVGLAFSLAANALSPRGLELRRNYFGSPADSPAASPAAVGQASHAEAVELFRDPRHAEQRVIFVDARSESAYQAGHIPGAYHYDHYRPGQQAAAVIAAAALAETIVVYCAGGSCEDSRLAAADLLALGVPAGKLLIYPGGITAWKEHHLPIVAGTAPGGAGSSP